MSPHLIIIVAFYEKFARKQYIPRKMPKKLQYILKEIGSNRLVLDVGCGDGLLSHKIKEQGNEVIGVDISSIQILFVIENYPIPLLSSNTTFQIKYVKTYDHPHYDLTIRASFIGKTIELAFVYNESVFTSDFIIK